MLKAMLYRKIMAKTPLARPLAPAPSRLVDCSYEAMRAVQTVNHMLAGHSKD